jgi:hypothetical protein
MAERDTPGKGSEMKIIIALTLCALAGCSTYEERVAGHCARLGEGPGTAYYHACVERSEALDQRNREMWGATGAAGAAMLH